MPFADGDAAFRGQFVVEELLPSAARTADGNTAGSDGYATASSAVVHVNVTAFAGTSPTLAVYLEDSIDGTVWSEVASVTGINAVGVRSIRSTGPFTNRLRLRYALGGTAPSFTFSASLYAERHGIR